MASLRGRGGRFGRSRTDRPLFRAAGGAGRSRPARRRRFGRPAAGDRTRRHRRRSRRGRSFLRRRPARSHRRQGACRESVRSCRQGRRPARLPADAGVAARLDAAMAGRVFARTRRSRARDSMSAARRRYGGDDRPAGPVDHGARRGDGRTDGAPVRRPPGRRALCFGDHWRRRARPCPASGADRRRPGAGLGGAAFRTAKSRPRSTATCRPGRACRWRGRCAPARAPRWTFPTASSAICAP